MSTYVDVMAQKKTSMEPEDALAAVVALRRKADQMEREAVGKALALGWSWADIAQALGVSRQAAHKRLAHQFKK